MPLYNYSSYDFSQKKKVYRIGDHVTGDSYRWVRFQKNGPWHLYSYSAYWEDNPIKVANLHMAKCQSSAFRQQPIFSKKEKPLSGRICKRCERIRQDMTTMKFTIFMYTGDEEDPIGGKIAVVETLRDIKAVINQENDKLNCFEREHVEFNILMSDYTLWASLLEDNQRFWEKMRKEQ